MDERAATGGAGFRDTLLGLALATVAALTAQLAEPSGFAVLPKMPSSGFRAGCGGSSNTSSQAQGPRTKDQGQRGSAKRLSGRRRAEPRMLAAVIGRAWAGRIGAPGDQPDQPAGEQPHRPTAPSPAPARPPAAADPVASYELRARLDVSEHTVDGEGVIRWRNASPRPQQQLYLHIYLNAFKNERTVFLRSSADRSFRGAGTPSRWGFVEVQRLYARELGAELWPPAPLHSPGDAEDETDIRVPLPAPVPPGGSLTLEVKWRSQLPALVLRTGFAGSFHMVAQWFPKLARLEPDGHWAHFPFHRLSEFYADFGSYDVRIDVPEGFVVGATGQQISEERRDGRVHRRFTQDGVHDFAFAAADGLEEIAQAGPGGVHLRMLFPAGRRHSAELELRSTALGLEHFARAYGRYPYEQLTVVHPPDYAAEAGGMEYPTMIMTGGEWQLPLLGVRGLEIVTVHELAHQWFYGLVATDEHTWPFLDEGLATYAQTVALESWYPDGSAAEPPLLRLRVGLPAAVRMSCAGYHDSGRIARPAPSFATGEEYGALVYAKAATLLLTLGRVYGEARLEAAIGRYARRHRFGHPTPDDLIAAVAGELGEQAAATLRAGLFDEPASVDYLVDSLQSWRDRPAGGVFGRPDKPQPAPPLEADGAGDWRGSVLVRRRGDLSFPVQVALHGGDGSIETVVWDGQERQHLIAYRGHAPLVAVEIDPEQRILLDQNLLNNVRRSAPQTIAPHVWAHASFAAQVLQAAVSP